MTELFETTFFFTKNWKRNLIAIVYSTQWENFRKTSKAWKIDGEGNLDDFSNLYRSSAHLEAFKQKQVGVIYVDHIYKCYFHLHAPYHLVAAFSRV